MGLCKVNYKLDVYSPIKFYQDGIVAGKQETFEDIRDHGDKSLWSVSLMPDLQIVVLTLRERTL